jgi:DNA-binding MarR family transcriptional regulator
MTDLQAWADLSGPQREILLAVAEWGHPNMTEIHNAADTGLAYPTTCRNVHRLRDAGFVAAVEREDSAAQGNRLTDSGRRALTHAAKRLNTAAAGLADA